MSICVCLNNVSLITLTCLKNKRIAVIATSFHLPKEFRKSVIFLMLPVMTSMYSLFAQSCWICFWIVSRGGAAILMYIWFIESKIFNTTTKYHTHPNQTDKAKRLIARFWNCTKILYTYPRSCILLNLVGL